MVYSLQARQDDSVSSLARQMTKWVDQVIGQGFQKYCSEESWTPAINLYEDDAEYYVVVDLAGMEVDKIDLTVKDGRMTLAGFRAPPAPSGAEGQVRLHLMEIDHGRFSRTLALPDDVDVAAIPEGRYCAGLLWIRLPKKR